MNRRSFLAGLLAVPAAGLAVASELKKGPPIPSPAPRIEMPTPPKTDGLVTHVWVEGLPPNVRIMDRGQIIGTRKGQQPIDRYPTAQAGIKRGDPVVVTEDGLAMKMEGGCFGVYAGVALFDAGEDPQFD